MTINTKQGLDSVQGEVERVTFHSEESGFCVLRIRVKGRGELVTITGSAPSIASGEYIECQGAWFNDKRYGMQFKAETLKSIAPTTIEGMEKYLGSGMVKGIGPHFAKKLVAAFGDQVFHVIEKEPRRLQELEGIGAKRQESVAAAWSEQKVVRNIMVFLQSYGIGTARSVRIYKTYGDDSINIVSNNPYKLALDIRGIGFKTADALALSLGIGRESLMRAQAGVKHVLQELCNFGHCAAMCSKLISKSCKLLEIDIAIIEHAIECELDEKNIVQDYINGDLCLYPASLYSAEINSAERIRRLNLGVPPWGDVDCTKAIPWAEEKSNIKFAESQVHALITALNSKVSIITGGPGVGKTTIMNGLLQIIATQDLRIGLCAPTGRAAKRLTETTGVTAKTIHRLLDFDPGSSGFKHNQDNKLLLDVLIVDESSMIDIVLFNSLLKALSDDVAVIFVGDIDQLPSVGSGAVLSDLIKSEVITTVRLTEIFRQAKDSKIIVNAHMINKGLMPLSSKDGASDFFTIYMDTPEEIHACLLDVVSERLPKYYNFNSLQDIQVLTPMNKGGLGSYGLNVDLQKKLNPNASSKIERFGTTYALNDKVIQMTNNYDKEVFNGDIGFIDHIDNDEGLINIRFDGCIKEYELHELDEISLAYAISIHKSQGSEFPVVVIPVVTQHYMLLARNLLYTGITRGKELVVLIGQKKAINIAVKNNKEAHRLTKLAYRLQNEN